MDSLPTRAEVDEDLAAATSAAAAAARLRREIRRRRRRRDPDRVAMIHTKVAQLSTHSSILRSHLKRSDHHEFPYTEGRRGDIQTRLEWLRYERRQLKKMLPH